MLECLDMIAPILAQAGQAAESIGPGSAAGLPPEEAVSPWVAWINDYGSIVIFLALAASAIGVHINEDLLLIPAGVAVFMGHLTWTETVLAGYLGIVVGDTAWIWICRNFGTRLIHKKWFLRSMGPRRLLEAKHAMETRGVIVLILARFIPGTRTATLTMAGLLHLPWWKFFAVELSVVAITVPTQISIGYLGKALYSKAQDLGDLVTFGLAGAALLVAAFVAVRWYKQAQARKGPRPRARASWLRTFGKATRPSAALLGPTQGGSQGGSQGTTV